MINKRLRVAGIATACTFITCSFAHAHQAAGHGIFSMLHVHSTECLLAGGLALAAWYGWRARQH